MDGDGSIILQVIVIIVLIAINAFFAASEIALLQVNDSKMRKLAEDGNKKARKVLKLIENPGKLLSIIQVCVTLSGFLSSAFASDIFAELLTEGIIKIAPETAAYASAIQSVSVVVITIILSYFTLVFGELVPKRVAMKKSEKISLFAAGPLRFTGKIFSPFVKLLTVSVNGILRLMGINPNEEDDDVTEEDIRLIVDEGQEQGVIDADEGEMITNVLEFSDTTVGEVMTPRTEIAGFDSDATFEDVISSECLKRFSRFPVYKESLDDIIGVFHIRSLIGVEDKESFNIVDYIRKPVFVPESQKLDDVFDKLKDAKNHMAIVLDEFGGTAGIVTMEDILEELVGNIQDEYDEVEEEINDLIVKQDDGSYIVDGSAEIADVNDTLETELPDEEFNTISGFIIDLLGEIPEVGSEAEVSYENIDFKVIESTEKVITKLSVVINEKSIDFDDEDDDEDEDESKIDKFFDKKSKKDEKVSKKDEN